MSDLCFLTAVQLADRIRRRDVSVTEVVRAHLAQIERVNPKVNAIVTLTAEQALADARAKDAALARGETPGPLFGLPVAHKDLVPTRGIRTTYGSPIYRDHVPDQDGLIVERLRAAGAVTLGKSNTPEFGAGSQTFNEGFGRTLNPYDPTKTCGGSNGGGRVDARVRDVLAAQRKTFETLGCIVEDGQPEFTEAREIFQIWRAVGFAAKYGPLLARHRHQMKDTVVWNIEQAGKLSARDVGEADTKRTDLYHRVRA